MKIWPFSLKYARILPIFDKTDPLMYAVSKTRPTHVRTFWISKATLIGSSWYPRIYWRTPRDFLFKLFHKADSDQFSDPDPASRLMFSRASANNQGCMVLRSDAIDKRHIEFFVHVRM